MIHARDLSKEYVLKSGAVPALRGVNLDVKEGEYVSILGPSGSGKTTLFNLIGGLDTPTRGTVIIDGDDIFAATSSARTTMRCEKIGYIFQTFNLIEFLTAAENVALPMAFAGSPREYRMKRARELLERVGLGDRLLHHPSQLSGGQQQRLAVARALANNPSIILADEPTGNLDLKTGLSVVRLLYRLKAEEGTTVICATHDLKMIEVSDRIAWLEDGRIQRIEQRQGVRVTAEDLKQP